VTAAVLTPFTSADAVELGNRLWRKKVLPVGDVEYKGRTLHFTRDYLGRLAAAFQNRAYDMVPFQLADKENSHTNDPERTRGEVTAMELGDDGLYITAQLTEDGEKVLAANPKLGVSARIVEGYQRSDGKFFGEAVQHVLGTLDPRIPGLGAWQAIEAATPEPESVLDLSGESFTDLAGPKGFIHGWIHVGTEDAAPEDKADRMSRNISGHPFKDGPDGAEALSAHKQAAKAHRQAAKLSSSPSVAAHHQKMAKLHSAVASGRMESVNAEKKMDLASDPAGADPEGGAVMAGLTTEQQARLDKLLALPDDVLDRLAAGGTVVSPGELAALTAPGDGEDEQDADALAEEIAAMSDEDLAALEAEFNAQLEDAETPAPEPEREPVSAGMSAEAQFAIDLANAKADETARELAVVTARLREEDYQGEKRRLADMGVPPYITELARPLLEGAGHAVELSNGKTVDAGAVMRRVLSEYARQARLLDLDVELGSPMDEPEEAVRAQAETSREDVVARFKSMTGLR
jgi:hypothetical protein